MAKRYAVAGPSEAGTGPKTAATVLAAAAMRPFVYDVLVGFTTAPADYTAQLWVGLITAAGTAGSGPTPQKLDSGDPAAVCTAGITHSGEPTYAATPFIQLAINQRASFRWVAAPGGELVAPVGATNGVGVKNHTSGASVTLLATVHWFE